MVERPARSLEVLLGQVNALWPDRSKAADGWIGDKAHRQRKSDHNPNGAGVVCARDFTHDPRHGLDSEKLAEALRSAKDPRLNYLISNRKIAQAPGFAWVKYTGANPHDHHCHVSVKQDAGFYDVPTPWRVDGHVAAVVPGVTKLVPPLLKVGTSGLDVELLQTLLNKHSGLAPLKVDGDFGANTKKAVIAFQTANKLGADGVVGPYTWQALKGE